MNKFFILPLFLLLLACQPQNPPHSISQTSSHTLGQNALLSPSSQAVKIITPDWGVASTLTAMGYPPLAMGDIGSYHEWVNEPRLPENVIDIGERFTPNPERLAQLNAQYHHLMIIDNDFYAHLRPLYGDTPHTAVTFAPKGRFATWQDYVEPTMRLGEIIQQPHLAVQFLSQAQQRLTELGKIFQQQHPDYKKLAIVQFADNNNLRIYSNNSLFKPTLDAMGLELVTLENQLGDGNAWGFLPLSLGDLAKLDAKTCLVVIEPFSPLLRQELSNNLLWHRLGYGSDTIHSRCMTVLPPIWTYGGVSSMVTFAERLNHAEFVANKFLSTPTEVKTNAK